MTDEVETLAKSDLPDLTETPFDTVRAIRTLVMLSQSSTNFRESSSQSGSSTMPKIFDKLPLRIIPLGESLV